MLKITGLLWLYAIALYGIITVNQNSPEIAFWLDATGSLIGLGLLIKWAK